ncbi:MAG: hypothetical protein EXR58_08745 [Chloroflexi bacterium]|nr:hypothetical protein [Chloroflexota bacterium]
MDLTVAAFLAIALSLIVFILLGVWLVAPRLRVVGRAEALTALLWIHAFRHIALQAYSAQAVGSSVSAGLRDKIVYGDVLGMVLAVGAIAALRYRAPLSVALVWLFVAETIVDFSNAMMGGISEKLFAEAQGLTWLILTFYVPLLCVSLGMIIWQLVTRHREPW